MYVCILYIICESVQCDNNNKLFSAMADNNNDVGKAWLMANKLKLKFN